MRVPEENNGKAKPILLRLKRDYKMSQEDVARWCGVNKCVVSWWATGKCSIQDANLDKLKQAIVLLGGRQVRYKGQAIDILLGVE